MLKTLSIASALACAALVADARPALAQQTLNLSLGYFSVRGEDARVAGDILKADRNFLTFDINKMSGAAAGGEWLVPLGGHLEAGAGISFTRRTIPTVYTRFTNRDGSEIAQELRLRTVPVALTFRVLPLGQHSGFQPYIGGGLGVITWRYSESGAFVDFSDRSVFRNSYVKSGTRTGPVALGGIRFAGDTASAGMEVRYQSAVGDLDKRFAGSKIDLGGWTYQLTVGKRFGR